MRLFVGEMSEKESKSPGSYDELQELVKICDTGRYLGHMAKTMLIKGDASKTIPRFVEESHLSHILGVLFWISIWVVFASIIDANVRYVGFFRLRLWDLVPLKARED